MEAMTAETVIVEVLNSHGQVHARERLSLSADRRTFTVGRSTAADVMLDDPFVAALHVAIEVTPEGLRATDLGSANGIIVREKRHRNAQSLELPDGLLQVGRTHLRVRTRGEKLAAERPDHAAAYSGADKIAYPSALACALFIGYYSWLSAPWDTAAVIATSMMKALPVAGAWIALWALLSRVMTGEWRGMTHAAILFGVFAAMLALDWVVDLASFSLALPQWSWLDSLLMIAALALALYWHLTRVSTMRRSTAASIAVLLPVVAIGATTWTSMRDQDRNVNFIDAHLRLYPPVLRLREGGTVDLYFTAAARLRDSADRRRKALPEGDDTGEEE